MVAGFRPAIEKDRLFVAMHEGIFKTPSENTVK